MPISLHPIRRATFPLPVWALLSFLCLSLHAQRPQTGNPDAQIVVEPGSAVAAPAIPTEETAWKMLAGAAKDPKHSELRIQAIAAVGTLQAQSRGWKLISNAMTDPDLDVRTAAVLAAGEAKSPDLTFELRAALDDPEPQVAFVAATTLWKLHDRSGEDILVAIMEGERSASPTLLRGARHTLVRDLHNPATLARLGAMQGASFLLGPFGFGITAVQYMMKNGGDAARVEAIALIAQQRSTSIRDQLVGALVDRDPAVRAAAAQALGQYREQMVAQALVPIFNDPKAPVRLTAAAAFINASQPTARDRKPASHRAPPR